MFLLIRHNTKEEIFANKNCILVAVLGYEFSRNQETFNLP